MANEITVNVNTSCTNGKFTTRFDSSTQITQVAQGGRDIIVSIGTAEETLVFTDITTLGIAVFYNLDTTNYVQWGGSTGVYVGRLKPSDTPHVFRLEPGATIYMKADTAACKVRVICYEA
ncbi:MAG: hypothetical protein O2856_19520 [Planctomycetota bacterium]|nr:hypothetical protein [Planctomycetota bacterium]